MSTYSINTIIMVLLVLGLGYASYIKSEEPTCVEQVKELRVEVKAIYDHLTEFTKNYHAVDCAKWQVENGATREQAVYACYRWLVQEGRFEEHDLLLGVARQGDREAAAKGAKR